MPLKSKILITGGRDYADALQVDKTFELLRPYFEKDFCIIQGGATGADRLAKEWANLRGICCVQVDANWDTFKKMAGHIRNGWMIEFCNPDLVVAFAGGKGTANMVRQAELYGIDVYKVPN